MQGLASDSFECPHCGEPVRNGARVCRHCGASEDCGWNEADDDYSSDDDFDYDSFIEREFGTTNQSASEAASKNWRMRLIILAILVSWLLVYLV